MSRSELSDLIASGPASRRDSLERVSNAYDAEDFRRAADLLVELAREGHTSWHERAYSLADDFEWQADGIALQAMLGERADEGAQ